jgi:protease I
MSDLTLAPGGELTGHKIAVLMEADYVESEISYYERRFAEAGAEVHFLTRLWGQPSLTFTGHEWRVPMTVNRSFEDIDDATLASYSAVIVPSGIVSDRLRYTEDPDVLAPATAFVARAMAAPGVLTGVICHGLWLLSAAPELVRDRRLVVHNNLVGDARNMGARYVDQDVVIDGDLVTARSAYHCHLFARTLIELIRADRSPTAPLPDTGAVPAENGGVLHV